MSRLVKDKALILTAALPNGAASANTDGIDLKGGGSNVEHAAEVEFQLDAPALTTSQLGDTQTITYIVQMDDDSAFGSATTLYTLVVQTGAGGAGDGAEVIRFRCPTNVERYMRVRATKTGASNASTASMTLTALF
jgi:hypothetical protein